MREGLKRKIMLVGILPEYFILNPFQINSGSSFLPTNLQNNESVCIIGHGIKIKLFPGGDAIGKYIKVGINWLKVIGCLEEKHISKENIKNLNIRDFNFDIYIPLTTMLIRYKNRSLVTRASLHTTSDDDKNQKEQNDNQIDKLVVGINSEDYSPDVSEIINRILLRHHNNVRDFEITVPELLLEQEQRTKRIFNIVLGVIASISLLVGGIGIMNIMLASVMERTKEIGIRLAVGAKQHDILLQFLSEAIAISITGGIIGIILGISASYIIEKFTDIKTIVTVYSTILSFLVAFY